MSTNKNENRRLQELSGSDYEMVDGEPDIRGWDVKDASGRRIGEVDELIFDVESRKVRYMVLDLEGNVLDLEDRDVLVPIGLAQLHSNDDDVILNNVTADQLRSLPEYDDDDSITSDYESTVRNIFGGAALAGAAGAGLASGTDRDTNFYDHEHFNDQNLYQNRKTSSNNEANTTGESIPVIREELEVGKREVETGGIRLRSRMVEKPVEETVSLREETVNIERKAVDRPATEADLKEESIEMRERDEVPVVHKEARVVEEIKIGKEVTERDETIRDTIRDTEVDINRTDGNSRNSAADLDNDLN